MDNSNEEIYFDKMKQAKVLRDPLEHYYSILHNKNISNIISNSTDESYISYINRMETEEKLCDPFSKIIMNDIDGLSDSDDMYSPAAVRLCSRKLYNLKEEPEYECCTSSDSENTDTTSAPERGNKNISNIMDNSNEKSYIDKMEPEEQLYDPFSKIIKYDIEELSDSDGTYTPATVRHCSRKLYMLTEEPEQAKVLRDPLEHYYSILHKLNEKPEEEYCASSDSEEFVPLSTSIKYNINELNDNEDPYTPAVTGRHRDRKLYKLTEEPEDEYCSSSDSEDTDTTNAPDRNDCVSPKICVDNAHVPAKWDGLRYSSEDAIWHVPRSVALRPEDSDMQDFFRIRDTLKKFGITEKDWTGKDFLQMARDMRALKKEGTMELDFCSQLKKLIVKKNGIQELNMVKYHRTLNSLIKFSSTKVSNEFLKMTMGIKALHETDPLIKNFAWFKKMIEESDNIQIRIDKFKFKGVPDIIEDMQTLLELGLLNNDHLSKFEETAKQCEELAIERENQIMKIEDTLKGIKIVFPELNSENVSNTESTLEVRLKLRVHVPRKHRKKSAPKVYTREMQSENVEKESKSRICRSEHNTPFCSNCGWRYSWLKAFKKRGVYIKDAANFTNKNIWQSSIK